MTQPQPEFNHKFHTLDALRGIAALAVVVLHNNRFFVPLGAPHAYLAVDFFFCLSGFVLSYAYQHRLERGIALSSWMKTRFVRLYPLYFLGLLLGAAFTTLRVHAGVQSSTALGFLGFLAPNLLLLPSVAFYVFNPPCWSLFFELLANLVHGLFFRTPSAQRLWLVTTVSGVLMAIVAESRGTVHFGYVPHDFLIGLGVLRVTFSYNLGCLLLRRWKTMKQRWRVPPILVALALLSVLVLPTFGHHTNATFEILCLLVVFPLIVLAGACAELPKTQVRAAAALGALSYPLYVLHMPLFDFLEQVWRQVFHTRAEVRAPWSGLVLLVTAVAISVVAEHFDPPARRWLSARLIGAPRQSAPIPQQAKLAA